MLIDKHAVPISTKAKSCPKSQNLRHQKYCGYYKMYAIYLDHSRKEFEQSAQYRSIDEDEQDLSFTLFASIL